MSKRWSVASAAGGFMIGAAIVLSAGLMFAVRSAGDGEIPRTDRKVFPDKISWVAYNVHPIKQSSAMSCWAAVFTMMKAWRDGHTMSVSSAVSALGAPYVDDFRRDTGLPGGGERDFVARAGMVAEPPANYSLMGFKQMLSGYGPLWIIEGDAISSHALLLVGLYGNSLDDTQEAYAQTEFELIDPARGAYTYRSGLDFMRDFEMEARVLVDGKADAVELRWQILHWPAAGAH